MNRKGFFLTVEGIEGVGKSTLIKFIQQWLVQQDIPFIATREPGGTPIAEQMRQILLAPHENEPLQINTELLLMFAARAQHVAQVILPALYEDKWVISDRFVDASFAYQGGGRGLPWSHIETLEHWVLEGLLPDVTILLDATPELGLMRAKHRGPHDRIEQEKVDFFERVRAGYLIRADRDPKRFRVIDASKPLNEVQSQVEKILCSFNGNKRPGSK
jgi:dTMP kinase